jgi:H+-transporting ATPase
MAVFSIVSARERRWFWTTMPSRTLTAALAADVLAGTVLTLVGLPGFAPLPWWQTLAVLGYSIVVCLGANDALKVAMIRRHVPGAALEKPEYRPGAA